MYKLSPRLREMVLMFAAVSFIYVSSLMAAGCAQIISPTGGDRDTIPPKLLSANPTNGITNFRGNRITLNFDEYVIIEQLQENLLVSPTPSVIPYVDYKLRSVTIRLRDSLQSNTTYTINLGNAIRDLNESNPLKDFRFVFSTGPVIDSLTFSGKVMLAETGEYDSTMFALLYRNMDDSAVHKQKPSFISRVKPTGDFRFENLPSGTFRLFALKDRDNGKTYNNLTEVFAFLDTPVVVGPVTATPTLYAYAERRDNATAGRNANTRDKNLKYSTKTSISGQELTEPLNLNFNFPLVNFDRSKVVLTDTLNNPLPGVKVLLDSTGKNVVVEHSWKENTAYKIIVSKDLGKDSAGLALTRSDTVRFLTKRSEDYGSVNLRFSNLPTTGNLVLQFVTANEVVYSAPLASANWLVKLFKPGEYKLRILIDQNKNGRWDAGSYSRKLQPERVIAIPAVINVKGNWENEMEIKL